MPSAPQDLSLLSILNQRGGGEGGFKGKSEKYPIQPLRKRSGVFSLRRHNLSSGSLRKPKEHAKKKKPLKPGNPPPP
jgi:hypothetical protein